MHSNSIKSLLVCPTASVSPEYPNIPAMCQVLQRSVFLQVSVLLFKVLMSLSFTTLSLAGLSPRLAGWLLSFFLTCCFPE
jgi:hypothetical protein